MMEKTLILKHISRMLCLLISYSKFTRTDIQAEVTQEYDTILDRNIYTVLVSQRLVPLRKAKSC